jgi:large subunit ribosomal protein L4
MAKADTFSLSGVKKPAMTLPKQFALKVNMQLLSQAIRYYESNSHTGLAKTKTRAEVKISKRKIYRQKGTGNARHGAKSAPIFVGGGVTHGPRATKRKVLLNKKMRQNALALALSYKNRKNEVIVIDGLSQVKKARQGQILIDKLSKVYVNAKRFLLVYSQANKKIVKALSNLKTLTLIESKNLNAYQVFYAGIVIFDSGVFAKVKKDNLAAKKTTQKKKKIKSN